MGELTLEDKFLEAWLFYNPKLMPERQYKWHHTRKFVADFAFVEQRVLVEIMGTRSKKSRHITVMGYHRDCERMCIAQALGWRILYIDSMFDASGWHDAVKLVEDVIKCK